MLVLGGKFTLFSDGLFAGESTYDFEGCRELLKSIRENHRDITVKTAESPSPFCHSLLVKSHYVQAGHQMGRERRAHLLRLHRKVLEEILTSEEMAEILDDRAIETTEAKLLHRSEETQPRNADELAQAIHDIGEVPARMEWIEAMVEDRAAQLIQELIDNHRVVAIRVPDCEESPFRIVSSDAWRLYFDAYAQRGAAEIALRPRVEENRFIDFEEVAPGDMISPRWLDPIDGDAARREVLDRHLRSRGPVSFSEIINHTGWTPNKIRKVLGSIEAAGTVVSGVYTSSKPKPQWVNRANLEQIHRLTMGYLKRELAACAPYEVVDFITRWQHVHPDTRLEGVEGLRAVIGQIQGLEPLQAYVEPDILAGRVIDYSPDMLDSLIAAGEVRWLRVGTNRLQRGRVSLCFREDVEWLSTGSPLRFDPIDLADADIRKEIAGVRAYFAENHTAFFDDVVRDTGIAEGYVLRAVWYLTWTGELTCDTYACLRNAGFTATLSACYDLASTPAKILRGVTTSEAVTDRMERRGLNPRMGRWSATFRLLDRNKERGSRESLKKWVSLLLNRWGIVTKDILAMECAAPSWSALMPEFKRLELLGKVSRGYYIESHYGIQFGLPEAIELLRECRARRSDGRELGYLSDEAIFCISGHDPANLYMKSLDILDDRGIPLHRSMKSGNVHISLLMQAGQVLLYSGGSPSDIRQLTELDGRRLKRCFRVLKSGVNEKHSSVAIRRWNGHPIDVSPMARVLWEEGFRFNGKREIVYPPIAEIELEPKCESRETYKPFYSEEAPVEYNEAWVLSRSNEKIKAKLSELFDLLNRRLPKECTLNYSLPLMIALYRGKRCAFIHIQRRQIRVHISYRGWVPGISVQPKTDLQDAKFLAELNGQFQSVFDKIDEDIGVVQQESDSCSKN